MGLITAAVGAERPNRPADVRAVQMLLNRTRVPMDEMLEEDGSCGPLTQASIRRYQQRSVSLARPDAVVDPGGPTIRLLARQAGRKAGAQYMEIAAALDCEIAAVKAFVQTEATRDAFDELGRPTILFERHNFTNIPTAAML